MARDIEFVRGTYTFLRVEGETFRKLPALLASRSVH